MYYNPIEISVTCSSDQMGFYQHSSGVTCLSTQMVSTNTLLVSHVYQLRWFLPALFWCHMFIRSDGFLPTLFWCHVFIRSDGFLPALFWCHVFIRSDGFLPTLFWCHMFIRSDRFLPALFWCHVFIRSDGFLSTLFCQQKQQTTKNMIAKTTMYFFEQYKTHG